MRKSIIKAKLKKGEPVLVTTLHLTDPSLFELVGLMGFDGIWMDLEHHGYSVETAQTLMRAARVGDTDIVARPAKGEWMRLGRLLESGATGILYPRCESASEAEEVVSWSKFHPLGRRGLDGAGADAPYCTLPTERYVREANEETFVAIQIEDQGAVEQAGAIAGVEGVDVLFFGPADFSVLSGVPGQFDHPSVQRAIDQVARAAADSGKHWGMPAPSAQAARALMDRGARFIACGADLLMVKAGMERLRDEFGPLGFTFADHLKGDARNHEKA